MFLIVILSEVEGPAVAFRALYQGTALPHVEKLIQKREVSGHDFSRAEKAPK